MMRILLPHCKDMLTQGDSTPHYYHLFLIYQLKGRHGGPFLYYYHLFLLYQLKGRHGGPLLYVFSCTFKMDFDEIFRDSPFLENFQEGYEANSLLNTSLYYLKVASWNPSSYQLDDKLFGPYYTTAPLLSMDAEV